MSPAESEALVRSILSAGETYYAEFKSAWHYGPGGKSPRDIKEVAEDIGDTLVGFANSDGGDLVVGVEDDGTPTGLPWDGDRLQYLMSAPKHQVRDKDLGAQVLRVTIDGTQVLLFRVEESPGEVVVTASGRCLWRRGRSTEPIPPPEVDRRRRHRLGDSRYESEPVPQATLADLDVNRIAGQASALSGYLLETLLGGDTLGMLRYWNLLESRNGSVILRRAALLLFAREPLRWHPNNRVRLRVVRTPSEGYGRDLGSRDLEVSGPIATMIPAAIQALRRDLEVERREQSLFSTGTLLPREAVEECIVNAIAHRNYAVEGNAIEVLLFPDRVEFRSPGRLPEPLTVDDLKARNGAHRSRNPLIMRVLRDLGWARDQGEGMRRIFGAMSQVELHDPELEEAADTFIVRLSTMSLYDEATRTWIAAYGPFGLRPEERKFMVALRAAGGRLSVDRLARQLNKSFDETKRRLEELDRKGLVWHAHKSRTYRLVEPLAVLQERAFRVFEAKRIPVAASTSLNRQELMSVAELPDERSFTAWLDRMKEAGILMPSGKATWKFGSSMLEYLRHRRQ